MDVHRVTANLPANLLTQACEITGKGITETLIEALELIKRQRAFSRATQLKGKLNLDIDLNLSRERQRH